MNLVIYLDFFGILNDTFFYTNLNYVLKRKRKNLCSRTYSISSHLKPSKLYRSRYALYPHTLSLNLMLLFRTPHTRAIESDGLNGWLESSLLIIKIKL